MGGGGGTDLSPPHRSIVSRAHMHVYPDGLAKSENVNRPYRCGIAQGHTRSTAPPSPGSNPCATIPQSQDDFGVALQLPRKSPRMFRCSPRKLPLFVGNASRCEA